MTATLLIAGAVACAVVAVGLVLWFSMKVTDRKEAENAEFTGPSGSAGGYQADYPGDMGGGGSD